LLARLLLVGLGHVPRYSWEAPCQTSRTGQALEAVEAPQSGDRLAGRLLRLVLRGAEAAALEQLYLGR
jgi:hypothetical protein